MTAYSQGSMEALENLLFDLGKAAQLTSDDFWLRRIVSRAMPLIFDAAKPLPEGQPPPKPTEAAKPQGKGNP